MKLSQVMILLMMSPCVLNPSVRRSLLAWHGRACWRGAALVEQQGAERSCLPTSESQLVPGLARCQPAVIGTDGGRVPFTPPSQTITSALRDAAALQGVADARNQQAIGQSCCDF